MAKEFRFKKWQEKYNEILMNHYPDDYQRIVLSNCKYDEEEEVIPVKVKTYYKYRKTGSKSTRITLDEVISIIKETGKVRGNLICKKFNISARTLQKVLENHNTSLTKLKETYQ
ncbi:hypothetical protein [Carboxylicivirga sp. RSCT41]|uniref:hypothetical protein n=1 Tax=Carboxylicivirga agarovorans TaxID=3417570 RepID=UPI003D3459F1